LGESFAVRILLVEDDVNVAGALSEALGRFGYAVNHVQSGISALDAVTETDFVLLDLGLPDLDGQEVCRRVRAFSDIPIMVVTGRSDEVDRVVLLQSGADDYLVKPYSTRELIARIEAVSRRSHGGSALALPTSPDRAGTDRAGTDRAAAGRAAVEPAAVEPAAAEPERGEPRVLGPLRADLRTRQVWVADRELLLTRREFDLLAALLVDPGAVRQREDLLDEVWDVNWYGSTRTLDVHVGSLRSKLGHRDWIQSVRGVGFRLCLPPATSDATPVTG
jgi:two-component system response regulator RegX3